MSKELTPIQELLKYFTKCYNFYTEGNPVKDVYKNEIETLKLYIPVEEQFAKNAFEAGEAYNTETSDPSWRATYETENPDFDDYFKQYKDE